MNDAFALWFTGLPCSGKTTLSDAVEKELLALGLAVEHLDGDVIRKKFSPELGFSKKDREAQIERVAFEAAMLTKNGVITLASIISPYRAMRQNARQIISGFIEIYVRCPLEVCERRDVKGMYALARKGVIKNFTGISDVYEAPTSAEIVVNTDVMDVKSCVDSIMGYLISNRKLGSVNSGSISP